MEPQFTRAHAVRVVVHGWRFCLRRNKNKTAPIFVDETIWYMRSKRDFIAVRSAIFFLGFYSGFRHNAVQTVRFPTPWKVAERFPHATEWSSDGQVPTETPAKHSPEQPR